jgi:solute carrier family 25 carnitine/acylcarnitine transporter 20/29
MQTQRTVTELSPIRLLIHIVRNEGIASVYKGVGPPLLSLSIVNTLSFTSYSYFRQNVYHGQDGWDMNNAFSGMMAAPVFGIITTPENFVKTQMQLDNVQNERVGTNTLQMNQLQSCSKGHEAQRRGRFSSSLQCARTLVSSYGVSILYTGHVINTVREAAFVGTYFFCYEGYKEEFRRLFNFVLSSGNVDKGHSSSFSTSVAVPMAGGFAGASAWAITFPLDCVRAGMQGQPILSSSSQSTAQFQKQGSLKILQDLLHTKGFTGLYAGVTPSIVRAFLVSGSRFSAYEGALWLFRYSGTSQLK